MDLSTIFGFFICYPPPSYRLTDVEDPKVNIGAAETYVTAVDNILLVVILFLGSFYSGSCQVHLVHF